MDGRPIHRIHKVTVSDTSDESLSRVRENSDIKVLSPWVVQKLSQLGFYSVSIESASRPQLGRLIAFQGK